MQRMEIFCEQIVKANNKNVDIIILGDSNLDANKWDDSSFLHANVASVIKNSLLQNGIEALHKGNTNLANHAQKNGNIAESALDHGHCSVKPINKTTTTTIYTSRAVTMTHILFLITCTQ